jgi:hypothetical protein
MATKKVETKKKPINSRAKGIRFERQLCQILTEKTGIKINRNWQAQSAVGGFDLEGLPNFAVEVKACKDLAINKWWAQCSQQAADSNRVGVLFYKRPLLDWLVVFDLEIVSGRYSGVLVTTSIDDFLRVAKEANLL